MTSKQTPKPEPLWFVSRDEELWFGGEPTREAAIALGRNDYDGDAFWIARGGARGPWLKLFTDGSDLGEFIDDRNEDNSYEDGFCAEAGLSNTDLQGLADQLNAIWAAFVAERDLKGNAMDLSDQEQIEGLTHDQ